jgi:serine/threonine protein phosphatase PrpC
LKKKNQDNVSICLNFANRDCDALFAVFDGHGKAGELCSKYATKHLPETLAKYIKKLRNRQVRKNMSKISDDIQDESLLTDSFDATFQDLQQFDASVELSKGHTQLACHTAHIHLNNAMHHSKEFDDSLSGTTAISCLFQGRKNRITVCNVGDSRAVLGRKVTRQSKTYTNATPNDRSNISTTISYQAIPLSRDQTPYRRDERIRIKATGARILSLDQIEGLEPFKDDEDESIYNLQSRESTNEEIYDGGDPPRVWSANGDFPGTAFTRSLGDSIAEKLGVYAEPEMVTINLDPDDKIIVLASDGVFEFLTNQSVIDICAKFSDPAAACRAVVSESYELWLQYELRSDDISVICIFIDDVDWMAPSVIEVASPTGKAKLNGFTSLDALLGNICSEDGFCASTMTDGKSDPEYDHLVKSSNGEVPLPILDKVHEDKARLISCLKETNIFNNYTGEQLDVLVPLFDCVMVKQGDWVIRQGLLGDRFYIVDHGRFEVRVIPDSEEDVNGTGGSVVHVLEGSMLDHIHPYFGEKSLFSSTSRDASVVADSDGQLWVLHRHAFQIAVAKYRFGRNRPEK